MFYEKKILKDLPLLVKKGLIDECALGNLQSYYEGELAKPSLFKTIKSLSLYLIGAIFIILAAYLFIGYNWSVFSNSTKAVLMFSPLVASIPALYIAIKRQTFLTQTVALALNLTGLILAFLAPSVIYNVSGSELDFFTVLVFLFCPLAIIFRNFLGLLTGIILLLILKPIIRWESVFGFVEYCNIYSFAFLFFGGIFLYQSLSTKEELSFEYAFKLLCVFLLSIAFFTSSRDTDAASLSFIMAFALGSIAVCLKRESLLFLALAVFSVVICMMSSWGAKGTTYFYANDLFLRLSVIGVSLVGLGYFAISIYKKRECLPILILGLILLHTLIYILIPNFVDNNSIKFARECLSNASVFILFALIFARGVRLKSLLLLNESFAILILYSLIKLNDKDWSMMARSGLFLAVGIIMIASNIILNRKIKQNEKI
ncbi:MAG: DUF2157 domain-containing protein [Opitutales bacterium]